MNEKGTVDEAQKFLGHICKIAKVPPVRLNPYKTKNYKYQGVGLYKTPGFCKSGVYNRKKMEIRIVPEDLNNKFVLLHESTHHVHETRTANELKEVAVSHNIPLSDLVNCMPLGHDEDFARTYFELSDALGLRIKFKTKKEESLFKRGIIKWAKELGSLESEFLDFNKDISSVILVKEVDGKTVPYTAWELMAKIEEDLIEISMRGYVFGTLLKAYSGDTKVRGEMDKWFKEQQGMKEGDTV